MHTLKINRTAGAAGAPAALPRARRDEPAGDRAGVLRIRAARDLGVPGLDPDHVPHEVRAPIDRARAEDLGRAHEITAFGAMLWTWRSARLAASSVGNAAALSACAAAISPSRR